MYMSTCNPVLVPIRNFYLRSKISSCRLSFWFSRTKNLQPFLSSCQCGKLLTLPKISSSQNKCLKLNYLPLALISHKTTDKSYGTLHGSQKALFTSVKAANTFVSLLLPDEREALKQALKYYQQEESKQEENGDNTTPTFTQLRQVIVNNAIPFVGFGFLDNAIMIMAGEYIDHTVGITLGISTMAAAAVGNIISDICGLGLAGYVEVIAMRIGFQIPHMNASQAAMWQTKYCTYLGRGIGIVIGCIIGMFPLLFIGDEESKPETELT